MDPLSPTAGLQTRLILASGVSGLVWLLVCWAWA